MDSEGARELPDADLVVQNRTGAVRHATVRCQTSTSTIFSEMIELDSGEIATYDDLPQELIELQVSVADGPKGSKMYDAETVSGTVAVGVTGSAVLFETTSDPVATVAELDDIFDDGGIGEASTDEAASADTEAASSTPTDDPAGDGDDATDGSDGTAAATDGSPRSTSDTSGSDRSTADSGGSAREASGPGDSDRTDRATANADAASSRNADASDGETRRSTSSDVAGADDSNASVGEDRRDFDGSADRTPGSDPSGTAGETSETTSSADDEGGPGPDEIHCRNCGEIIRANAEICPECGTRNAAQADRRAGRTAGAEDTGDSDRSDAQSASSEQSAVDDSDRGPGPDEIHCRSCGEIIKERAEICPECGTQNVAQSGSPSAGSQPAQGSRGGRARTGGTASAAQSTGSAGGGPATQGQSTGSEPSGSWVNGVRLGALLWFLVLLLLVPTVQQFQSVTAGSGVDPGGMLQSLGLAVLLPPVQLLAWIVLPLSLYFDLKYVDYHVDEWPLRGRLYIASAAILPVLTQILGAAALFIDAGGAALAAVIPVSLLALSIRHLRMRSRLV